MGLKERVSFDIIPIQHIQNFEKIKSFLDNQVTFF